MAVSGAELTVADVDHGATSESLAVCLLSRSSACVNGELEASLTDAAFLCPVGPFDVSDEAKNSKWMLKRNETLGETK
jgi:hypothetical protein